MSRRGLPWWMLPVSWACLALWAVVMALALAGVLDASALGVVS